MDIDGDDDKNKRFKSLSVFNKSFEYNNSQGELVDFILKLLNFTFAKKI
jgi:hypothetical protein